MKKTIMALLVAQHYQRICKTITEFMSICRICAIRKSVDSGRCQQCQDYFLIRGHERPLTRPIQIKKKRILFDPPVKRRTKVEIVKMGKAVKTPWKLGMPKRRASRKMDHGN